MAETILDYDSGSIPSHPVRVKSPKCVEPAPKRNPKRRRPVGGAFDRATFHPALERSKHGSRQVVYVPGPGAGTSNAIVSLHQQQTIAFSDDREESLTSVKAKPCLVM